MINVPTAVAKGLSFVTGTMFAYVANRLWTFDRAEGGGSIFGLFVVLYVVTLTINVALNSTIISLFDDRELGRSIGFLAATGTSATLNFIGMKTIVFRGRTASNE
jgi:putative flippase GtrA